MVRVGVRGLLGLCVLGSLMEVRYQKGLEKYSAEMISAMQSSEFWLVDQIFFVFEALTAAGFIFTSVIIYLYYNRELGAISTILGLLGGSLAGFLKMCFLHPRPIYAFASVRAIGCSKDFGFPSGHTFSAGCVAFFLGSFWLKDGFSLKKLILLATSLFIVAIDRLYLGAHFHFQVIMGYAYSALLISIVMENSIYNSLRSALNNRKNLIVLHGLVAFYLILGLIVYRFRNGTFEEEWVRNFEEKCGKETGYWVAILKNLDDCTLVAVGLGLCVGCYLREGTPVGEMNKMNLAAVLVVLAVGTGGYMLIEKAIKLVFPAVLYVVILTVFRYLLAAALGWGLPVVVQSIARRREKFIILTNSQIELKNPG